MITRKNAKRLVCAALAGAGLFATATLASAGVSKVLCVPMQGDPAKYHTAISGQAVLLTAVIYGDATGGSYSFSWDVKDGSPVKTATISVPANGIYNLEVTHTYSGAMGLSYPTTLTIGGITDKYNVILGPNNNDSKVNIAIDKGLWYLHKEMIRTTAGSPAVNAGYWNDSGSAGATHVGRTGAPIWAFEVQGHLLNVEANPLAPVEDPYVEDVQRGINYILSRTYPQTMSAQAYGNPDSNGNGYGLIAYYDAGHTNYEQGLAMGAIAGSGTPNAIATTSSPGNNANVVGRTYKEIVQDMVDWYAWSQIDDPLFPPNDARGGWYYTANANYSNAYYGDNSASQWAYIGFEAAQTNFGCTVPLWVKTQVAGYLHGQLANASHGYVSYRADGGQGNVVLTGGALIGMALVGEANYNAQNGAGAYASDLALAKAWLGSKWRGTQDRWENNWYTYQAYYTMYAMMKAFRLHGITSLPGTPGTSNWYTDYVGAMLPDQFADGHWYGDGWMAPYIREDIATAFGVLILTPSVFAPPPVACFTAAPNPSYSNFPVVLNASCSYHSDPTKQLVSYEWDLDNDGQFDDATGPTASKSWPVLNTYPVSLRVTDNSNPALYAVATLDINITIPPHPPAANAGGPYWASSCVADTVALDGSKSKDPDEGLSASGNPPFDTITAWNWDLNGAPYVYDGPSGKTATVASSTFPLGMTTIGLKVTDNSALAYPGPNNNQVNLTGEATGTVTISQGCICNLVARSKATTTIAKVQLTWTHTGAAGYDIYRSETGPNTGFVKIASNYATTYATYLDSSVAINKTYWYRVVSNGAAAPCGSNGAKAVTTAAIR